MRQGKTVLIVFALLWFFSVNVMAEITLKPIGTFATGVFDEGAAEIVAYDSGTQRLFVVNGANAAIDVIGISDPTNPSLLFSIDVTPFGKEANSVAVRRGIVAAAVENETSA